MYAGAEKRQWLHPLPESPPPPRYLAARHLSMEGLRWPRTRPRKTEEAKARTKDEKKRGKVERKWQKTDRRKRRMYASGSKAMAASSRYQQVWLSVCRRGLKGGNRATESDEEETKKNRGRRRRNLRRRRVTKKREVILGWKLSWR